MRKSTRFSKGCAEKTAARRLLPAVRAAVPEKSRNLPKRIVMQLDVRAATYWDASALLSALLPDVHSDEARARAQDDGERLFSCLGWVEALAVMARLERQGALGADASNAAHRALMSGRWRAVRVTPRWDAARRLGHAWPLRGADLWHLAAAKRLQEDVPTLRLLSFDRRLLEAAQAEGLA